MDMPGRGFSGAQASSAPKTDFRRSKRLGERDHLIVLTKPVSKPDC